MRFVDPKSEVSAASRGLLYVIACSPGWWDWPTWLNKPWKDVSKKLVLTTVIFNQVLIEIDKFWITWFEKNPQSISSAPTHSFCSEIFLRKSLFFDMKVTLFDCEHLLLKGPISCLFVVVIVLDKCDFKKNAWKNSGLEQIENWVCLAKHILF